MTTEQPPNREQMARMARRMRRVNVPMRALLGLPFPTPLGSRLMLPPQYEASRARIEAALPKL